MYLNKKTGFTPVSYTHLDVYKRQVQKVVEKFKALIENNATLKNVDEWGKRKLAYLINKESEGYYVLFDFARSVPLKLAS